MPEIDEPTPDDFEFDRVLDAVADCGLGPDGDDPIDDTLDEHLQAGTKIEFPAGEYRITRKTRLPDRSAIVGTAEDRADVRFVPPAGESFQWLNFNNSSGLLLQDFTIDRREEYDTSVGMGGNIKRKFRLQNVEYDGWTPSGPQLFASNVTTEDGVAVVDGLYRTGPTEFRRYPQSSLDIWSGRDHDGTLILRNIEIHNGSESGIYTGKGDGDYIIEDSYFKNVVHTAIRTAGEGSVIRGCTVVMDTEEWDSRNKKDEATYGEGEDVQLNRAIWAQTADREFAGPLIEDCDIIIRNTEKALAGVYINSDTGGSVIRNTRVRVDDEKVIPIYAPDPDPDAGTPLRMVCENVHVSGLSWREGAYTFEGRPNSRISDSHASGGGGGDGVVFDECPDSVIEDTTIDVGGKAFRITNGDVDLSGEGEGPAIEVPSEPDVRPSERGREAGGTNEPTETTPPEGANQPDDSTASTEPMQNVRDHGARGNGSHDDTQAIRDAADAAAPDGTVYFPSGTYQVGSNTTRPLAYPADGSWGDLTWRGESADDVTITMAGGHAKWHFLVHIEGVLGTTRFESLTLDVNKGQQDFSGGNGSHVIYAEDHGGKLVLQDTRLQNARNEGLRLSGTCDAEVRYSHIRNCGEFHNGGHAISPNQTTQATTTIYRTLFEEQGGADIDVGQDKLNTDWQTVVVEECIFRDNPRGNFKVCAENKDTIVRNTLLQGNDRTEIPVKMNPTDADIGTIALESVVIDGAKFPGIDFPCPGRLELDEVAIRNVGTGGHRNGAGIYTTGMEIAGTRVSIHDTDSQVTLVDDASGRIEELIHGGQAAGRDNGIVQSRTRGDPLTPDIPSEADIGPHAGEDDATPKPPTAPEEGDTPPAAPDSPAGDYVVMRASRDTAGGTPYEFVVEGSVEKGQKANDNDIITDNGDGTVTVTGKGGWGGVDDYYIQGEIVDAHWDDPASWSLVREGTEIPLSEVEATSPNNDGNVGVEVEGIGFDQTVDAVADLGLDPTGNAVCDSALASVEDSTCVKFPAGTYKLKSCWIRRTNIGLVAKDGADVTFDCEPTETDYSLLLKTGGNHVLTGIDIDRATGGDAVTIIARTGDLFIGDMELRGVLDGGVDGLSVSVEDPDGVGTLEKIGACDGSAFDSPSHGIFVAKAHAGTLFVRDCDVCNWTDNGLYASSPGYVGEYKGTETTDRGDGTVHVEGGRYENNNISQVRIGSTGSSVKGATIGVHTAPAGLTWSTREHDVMPRSGSEDSPVINARGIWLEGRTDLTVEDCDVTMATGRASAGIMVDSDTGAVTIRNTQIHVSSGECLYAIDAHSPSIGWDKTGIQMENVSVTGVGGSEGTAVRIRGRSMSVLRDSCVQVAKGDGVAFDSAGGTVVDSAVSAPGTAVVGGTVENLSEAEACPVPDGVSPGWPSEVESGDEAEERVRTLSIRGPTTESTVCYRFAVDGQVVPAPGDIDGVIPHAATRHEGGEHTEIIAYMAAAWQPDYGIVGELVAEECRWPAGATVTLGGEVIFDGGE